MSMNEIATLLHIAKESLGYSDLKPIHDWAIAQLRQQAADFEAEAAEARAKAIDQPEPEVEEEVEDEKETA